MATKIFSTISDIRSLPIAGQTAPMRLNLPCVGRVHNIKATVTKGAALATLADMRTAFGEMRLVLDTYTYRRWRFSEYLAMLEANGYVNEDGMFAFFFSEPWRATVTDEEKLALALGGRYSQAALEIDVTQPSTALALEVKYEFDYLEKALTDGTPVKGIIGHVAQVENVGGGQPIITINKDVGSIQRLYINVPSTVNVDRVQVLVGETVLFDRYNTTTRPEIKHQLKDMGMKIPANYTDASGTYKTIPVIFDNNQQVRVSFPENARLQLTLSAAAQVRLLFETRVQA